MNTLPLVEFDDPVAELEAIEREVQRRRHALDPLAWVTDRLGDTLWSRQQEILLAVATHRRVAVRSCHEIGKSYDAALLAGWWLDTAPPGEAFVVTTAPTGPQVKAILWREIGRMHTRGKLFGRLNQTEWYARIKDKEELVAFGRKPNEFDPAAFQGIHAPRVLVIMDEANGIRGPLHEAADSLIANDLSKIVMLGNPDDPQGEFFDACKPGSGWYVIGISAFDSPNFTGEDIPLAIKRQLIGRTYVEEKRRKWAPGWRWADENDDPTWRIPMVLPPMRCVPPVGAKDTDTNPYWQSKILGRFPENADAGGLIPLSWIEAAKSRVLEVTGPSELGMDVGGGGDSTTVAHRQGPVVRIIREDHNPDTMHTCGNLIADLRTTGAALAKVDLIGIGRGVVDRARELGKPVEGVNVSESPTSDDNDERFLNLRAELWWAVRERFEHGTIDIDPQDDDLAGELASLKYKRTSTGKIQIESKEEAKRRGIASPNRADALMLAFAPRPKPKKATYEVI